MENQDIRRLVYGASPQALGRVVTEGLSDSGLWGDGDQRDCLESLLARPMFDPASNRMVDMVPQTSRGEHAPEGEPLSINDLLNHVSPPVGMLEQLKRLAKNCAREQNCIMPSDVAMVLYYTAIAAAWSRCGQLISEMDHSELRCGIEWACSVTWTPTIVQRALQQGLSKLPRDGD